MRDILANRAFFRATLTNFFFFSSQNGFVLLPLYVRQLGGSDVQIGLVMGVYSAVGIVCQPLIGPWVDALGRRPFMLVGVGCVLASTLLAAVAHDIPLLIVVRILQGLAFSAFFVSNFSYVVDLVPPAQRGRALGIYGISGFASTALAPLLGEWLVRRWGFSALFSVSGVIVLVAGALVWQVREVPRGEIRYVRGLQQLQAGVAELFRRLMGVTFFFGLVTGTLYTFLPTFAESLGVRTVALFYTGYAFAAIGVRLVGGRVIDTHGRRAVIVPSMFVLALAPALLCALGFAAAHALPAPALAVVAMAGLVSGAAHGYLYPALAALVADDAPAARRGAVIGVFSAVFLAGQASGAFSFGWVAHTAGYPAMWLVVAACGAAGALVSLGLERPAGVVE